MFVNKLLLTCENVYFSDLFCYFVDSVIYEIGFICGCLTDYCKTEEAKNAFNLSWIKKNLSIFTRLYQKFHWHFMLTTCYKRDWNSIYFSSHTDFLSFRHILLLTSSEVSESGGKNSNWKLSKWKKIILKSLNIDENSSGVWKRRRRGKKMSKKSS